MKKFSQVCQYGITRQGHRKTRAALQAGMSVCAFMTVTPAAFSQEEAEIVLEEIVVTASKREQSVQDIAASVNVVSARTLDNLNVKMMEDLTLLTPSITSTGAGQGGASQVYFRGLSDGGDGNLGGTSPSAGVYLDEQPITTTQSNPDIHMYDVARVEALNGPQGTLYGASSSSGLLKIVTNDVNLDEIQAGFDLQYAFIAHGSQDKGIEGFLNIPVIKEKLGIRLVAWDMEYGGYLDNTLGSQTWTVTDSVDPSKDFSYNWDNADVVAEDYNTARSKGLRTKVKFQLNDNWSANFTYFHQNDERNGSWDIDPSKPGWETTKFDQDEGSSQINQFALTVKGSIADIADVTYAGAIMNRNYVNTFDWSRPASTGIAEATCDYDIAGYYVEYPLSSIYYENGFIPVAGYTNAAEGNWNQARTNYSNCGDPTYSFETDADFKRTDHEFRAVSAHGGPVRWIIGAIYDKMENEYDLRGIGDDVRNSKAHNEPGAVWQSENLRIDEEKALYGEAYLDVSDFTLTVGARKFWYDTKIDVRTFPTDVWYQLVADPFDTNYQSKGSDFFYKLGLEWRPSEDVMVYALRSEGYRQGGPNRATSDDVPEDYDPDYVTNYELGWKSTLADGLVRFNGSLFLMKWEDFQTATWNPDISAFGFTDNAGNAESKGAEITLGWQATDSLDLNLNAGYYDAKITKAIPTTAGDIPEGTRLPWVPEFKMSFVANYGFEISPGWLGFGRTALTYNSSSETELNPAASREADAWFMTNLVLGATNETWTVELSVRNLFDSQTERYVTDYDFIRSHKPRTVGLRLKYRY